MHYREKILFNIQLSFSKAICSIVVLLVSCTLLSQKMPSDYFDEALIYERNEDFDNSLASFEYIIKNHPKNGYYPASYYNSALILYKKKNYSESLFRFKNILKGNFNEYEPRGGGIMDDPYTNYRHWSSLYISKIFYDQKQYDSALYYFSLSDTLYDYEHFCGNAIEGNAIGTAMGYADLYEKLNQTDKAISALLKYAFPTLNGNKELIDELKQLLIPKTKTMNLKKELDKAISTVKKIENDPESKRDDEYVFIFLGNEIKIEAYYYFDSYRENPPGIQKIRKLIKASYFYETIASIK